MHQRTTLTVLALFWFSGNAFLIEKMRFVTFETPLGMFVCFRRVHVLVKWVFNLRLCFFLVVMSPHS